MASRELDVMNAEPAYLGIEIGELAAWVTVAYGKAGTERRWRAGFGAPPSPEAFLERLTVGVREVSDGRAIAGIGVASWAPVDERGVLKASAIMPEWDDFPLTSRLREAFRAPCGLSAGVNAAALAEATLGAGSDVSPVVYVSLGREVLSSLVYGGAPLSGAFGRIGQIGHWRVASEGPRCACGAIGHLNALCSSQSTVRLAIGLASQDEGALAEVYRVTGGRAESLTATSVVALASAGIEPLRDLVWRSADALGHVLAQLSLVVNPALIILGGPLGVAGGFFLERTRERLVEELRVIPSAGEAPRLAPATLEPYSALAGAWLLGQEAAQGRGRTHDSGIR